MEQVEVVTLVHQLWKVLLMPELEILGLQVF